MPVRPYLRRFLRKLVFDVLPGALASLVGAMLFAQHWSQPAPAVRTVDPDELARQKQEIARLISEEHALMVDFLKREQEREAARAPLTVNESKAREAATASMRRTEAVRESKPAPVVTAPVVAAPVVTASIPAATSGAAQPAPPRAGPSAAAKPPGERVAVESGPLVAPEPKQEGTFSRVTSFAFSWADKAVDATGLRHIPALVRTIKGDPQGVAGEFVAISDGRLSGARP